jgi:hypothetical protein
MTSWRESGREGEQGLQYLYGLYYLAESVPKAKNTHFSSTLEGGQGMVKKNIHSFRSKGTISKKREQHKKKNNIEHLEFCKNRPVYEN